jgi:hypothetical protein
MRFVTRRGKHPSDCAGDRAHPWAAGRELATGDSELLEQVLAAPDLEPGQLGKGLDCAASHPARAV